MSNEITGLKLEELLVDLQKCGSKIDPSKTKLYDVGNGCISTYPNPLSHRLDYSDERLNETVSDEKEEFYRGAKIVAYKTQWDGYDAMKDKTKRMHEIKCTINMEGLGITKLPERNDGGKLTSVNEAINQVKSLIDTCIENKWLHN